jgi:transcription termination factor Rho
MRKFTNEELQRNRLRDIATPTTIILRAELHPQGITWRCEYADRVDEPFESKIPKNAHRFPSVAECVLEEARRMGAAADCALIILDVITEEVNYEQRRQK